MKNNIMSSLDLRVARLVVMAGMVSLTTCFTGCKEPPAPTNLGEVGPPNLTVVANEEAQGDLQKARNELQEHFVKRLEAEAAAEDKKPRAAKSGRKQSRNDNGRKGDGKRAGTTTEKALKSPKSFGSGLIATPMSALFGAKAKLEKIKIHHGLQSYKAINGKPPQTHQEFMEEIVKKGQINLPPLRAGESYRFDPNEGRLGTLMIDRPRTLQE